ncbi:SulP family inorganic anion transporter [Carnobacterium sp. ISL-102]|uniref:SulP family inorganic anion transporter n=1 Tax=Carnobacterium sp. ISL-102 TaxID=2819142 RepID=UPI001BE6FC32|nr:SulP family inorganic anion transporter [Carnobacterium sp. ISL-102]MBT2731748.1 SulP family inorganic anion transporter [Carnobacterium sp. ISL-102]
MRNLFKKEEWLGNIKGDILAGIVVAIALIPEAIGFSLVAGLDPMVGLYGSFILSIIIAFTGGRPGMITGATGATALLVGTLVKTNGIEYLFAAGILAGILQVTLGLLGVAKLLKFIPRAVMVGFINALGIMIFLAQLEHFSGANTLFYILLVSALLILYIAPRYIKQIPAPLIAIIFLSALVIFMKLEVSNVGMMGEIKRQLPVFSIPSVPLSLETLSIIFPTSLAIAIVGLLESLLTVTIVDDLTQTKSSKRHEAIGQGIAGITNGFFGGLSGCAMIGQSIINVKNGGRTRLSSLTAGVVLITMIMSFGSLVSQIPMAVLVAIMITVSIGTIDWHSFEYMRRAPINETLVMLVTIVAVLFTHNLAIGVGLGVLLSALFFMVKNSTIHVSQSKETVTISGQLFFATVDELLEKINKLDSNTVSIIDVSNLTVRDDAGVKAVLSLRDYLKGRSIEIIGFKDTDSKFVDSLEPYLRKSSH